MHTLISPSRLWSRVTELTSRADLPALTRLAGRLGTLSQSPMTGDRSDVRVAREHYREAMMLAEMGALYVIDASEGDYMRAMRRLDAQRDFRDTMRRRAMCWPTLDVEVNS